MSYYRDPKANKIFKVGDKVKIKSLEEKTAIQNSGYCFEYGFTEPMEEYCGKVLEILVIDTSIFGEEKIYTLGYQNGKVLRWNWGKDMFDYNYYVCSKVIPNE